MRFGIKVHSQVGADETAKYGRDPENTKEKSFEKAVVDPGDYVRSGYSR